jgi:hypothetical protein
MNYQKPELNILGDAESVIQATGNNRKTLNSWDNVVGFIGSTPGYDLDE